MAGLEAAAILRPEEVTLGLVCVFSSGCPGGEGLRVLRRGSWIADLADEAKPRVGCALLTALAEKAEQQERRRSDVFVRRASGSVFR